MPAARARLPYLTSIVALLLGACENDAPTRSSSGSTMPVIEVERPTAGQLCDRTREMLGAGHGQALTDEMWARQREACVADFEAKRTRWGTPLYETFLSCAMRAKDMRTMIECDQVAERRSGLPIAETGKAESGPRPGGQRLHEALLASPGPALVEPVATVQWYATADEVSSLLPEVQRRIYRPSAHLLEAEWQRGIDDALRVVAWRAWLPAESTPEPLVAAWGQPRIAEDDAGVHHIWGEAPASGEGVVCMSFTQPRVTDGPQGLPHLRLMNCAHLQAWYQQPFQQRALADLLGAKDLNTALNRGGRHIYRVDDDYRYSTSVDAGDLQDTGWRLVVEGERLVALEMKPSGSRDPSLPERIRKLTRFEWSHGLVAEWTAQRTLRLTLGAG